MNINTLMGSSQIRNARWSPRLVVAEGRAYPEELVVDENLPVVETDRLDPAGGVVIPRGRFVAIGKNLSTGATRITATHDGKTPLTLHEGKNLTPIGFSVNQMFRNWDDWMIDSNAVKFEKEVLAEVPLIPSVNNSHGLVEAGSKVTGYFGSSTSTTNVSSLHKGKPVLWNGRKVYVATSAASGAIALGAALYPGIVPRIIFAEVASGAVTGGTAVWNATLGLWTYSGPNATKVTYDFGQDADQIGGVCLRIQSLEDILNRDDMLKWVEYAKRDTVTYPPLADAATRFPATQVVDESLTFTANRAKVAYFTNGLDVHREVSIKIQGTVVDETGTATTYTGSDWYTLPNGPDITVKGTFTGKFHYVNWRTGDVLLAANITSVTAAKISYSYITNQNGLSLWGGGVLGLTDGSRVNTLGSRSAAGIQAHLDFPDVTAAMRLIVA